MIVVLLACLGVALGAVAGFALASAIARVKLEATRDELARCRDQAEHFRRRLALHVYDREGEREAS